MFPFLCPLFSFLFTQIHRRDFFPTEIENVKLNEEEGEGDRKTTSDSETLIQEYTDSSLSKGISLNSKRTAVKLSD